MKSATPKVLFQVSGVPILLRVLKTAQALKPKSIGVIIGSGAGEVQSAVGQVKGLTWILQKERKGSGHAVKSASAWIKKSGKRSPHLLIVCGDTPLLRAETLKTLQEVHLAQGNAATVLSAKVDEPFGYGRIVKDDLGRVGKIVEEKDASPAEKNIREVNSGVYCFQVSQILDVLPQIKNENAKKEYYLTDTIEILNKKGARAGSVVMANGSQETMGVNSRVELAKAESQAQKEILEKHMMEGVTILNPGFTHIGPEVKIGRDTTILPGTMIGGKTQIGENCVIGPNAYIEDSIIGNGTVIRASFVYSAEIGNDAKIGPFTHIRQGTVVKAGARVGNFSEVKKSVIGKNAKVSHLSYIGDCEVGDEVNVGAGVITCNFDGVKKHKTSIGNKSFVGSNVNLVAPVSIGEGSVVGAGSTITEDVPAHSLALARPFQIVKKDWVKNKKGKS